jgi:hypothetical protein
MLAWQTKTIALELIHAAEQDVAQRRDGFISALERHLTFLDNHLRRSVSPHEAHAILKSTRRQISILLQPVSDVS